MSFSSNCYLPVHLPEWSDDFTPLGFVQSSMPVSPQPSAKGLFPNMRSRARHSLPSVYEGQPALPLQGQEWTAPRVGFSGPSPSGKQVTPLVDSTKFSVSPLPRDSAELRDSTFAIDSIKSPNLGSVAAAPLWSIAITFAPCAICGKTPKNESHAKKHAFQHTKPFMCGEPMCVKADGFATKNDVDRHRKSVHGLDLGVGKAGRFMCPVQGCPQARKSWARLDNLRTHVRRKHPMSMEVTSGIF